MMENLFNQALAKNETNQFFGGEGLYFFLNRESGGHSYYVQMSGWVANFVDHKLHNMPYLSTALIQFIDN